MTDAQGDLAGKLAAALTGKGHIVHGVPQLVGFVDYVTSRHKLIRNVETYEIRGALEIPRIELGLYQGSAEEANLPKEERSALSALRLSEIIGDCENEGLTFIFQVWADDFREES